MLNAEANNAVNDGRCEMEEEEDSDKAEETQVESAGSSTSIPIMGEAPAVASCYGCSVSR